MAVIVVDGSGDMWKTVPLDIVFPIRQSRRMESSLDTLRHRLSAHRKHWAQIAELGGVSLSTFHKVAYGYVDPRSKTLEKMSRGLEQFLFGDRPQ